MMKVLNKAKDIIPPDAVYIGRPSKWGNPFLLGKDGNREEVIRKFKVYVQQKPELVALIRKELNGKSLVCFCSPLACHGDVIMDIANNANNEDSEMW